MTDKPLLDVGDAHWAIIQGILHRHIPEREVWAFGSRAKWTAKEFSDLDLAVIGQKPMPLDVAAALADDFSESDLPWKVDVVDWATTSPSFRQIIERDKVVMQKPSKKLGGWGMRSEWPLIEIGEVAQLFDGPHATPKKTSSGAVFLGISSLKKGMLDLSSTEHLSEVDYAKWTKRVVPQAEDVVFSYETRIGEVAIIPPGLKCCLGRRMALLRPDRTRLLPKYLLYYFLSEEFQALLRARTIHGSTVERLPLTDFPSYPVRVPPLVIQESISSILQTIDDRITLLRETNATLEAIAQALFKSWFVDFDPVHAKMEGRAPEGMDEATAALFPESFEETELGVVPRGWGMAPIRDVVEGVYDGPHATPPEANEGPVFLGIKNLTGTGLDFSDIRHISEADWKQWTKRITPQGGDIVFSYEATLGFFALIPPDLRCCLGRRLALIRPKVHNGAGLFWFHQFIGADFQRLLEKHTIQGATVNRIALKEFPSYLVLNPPVHLQMAFHSLVSSLWARIQTNQTQIQTLSPLRDALLPRLISGQLQLSEAADAN